MASAQRKPKPWYCLSRAERGLPPRIKRTAAERKEYLRQDKITPRVTERVDFEWAGNPTDDDTPPWS